MKNQNEIVELEGKVESIRYYKEETGFCIFSLDVKGELIICKGNTSILQEGDFLHVAGKVVVHKIYGSQVDVKEIRHILPTEPEDIEEYLASNTIKGIGKVLAKRLVKAYGLDTFEVLEQQPEKASKEVKGYSLKKAEDIAEQLKSKHASREDELFFIKFGISKKLSIKIQDFYKKKGGFQNVIKNNPYQLIDDIEGISFQKADMIAYSVGIPKDSQYRIQHGILFVLNDALHQGHTYLPVQLLLGRSQTLLDLPVSVIQSELDSMVATEQLVCTYKRGEEKDIRYFLTSYFRMEQIIAEKLFYLSQAGNKTSLKEDEIRELIQETEEELNVSLDETQREAVYSAVTNGFLIITGGPGTGKTTTLNVALRVFEQMRMALQLAAPTGRAAKRMTEATGRAASTIHRMLPNPDEDDMIDADVVVIDESSMIDIPLMSMLLKYLKIGTKLILVGDVDQLPSVGPGTVLRHLIESECFPVVRLTKIHRQAEESSIVVNANKINRGIIPSVEKIQAKDYFCIRGNDPAKLKDSIKTLVLEKLPSYFGIGPKEIQILCPMRKGDLGMHDMNSFMQETLNPPEEGKTEIVLNNTIFREGDKVIHIKNNYQMQWVSLSGEEGTGVFNGDVGVIKKINPEKKSVLVCFDDDKLCPYTYENLEELELAYALTIHKSQGSEYPVVLIPLMNGGIPNLFNRNLIYTAVTRSKMCVGILGNMQTYARMILNDKSAIRYSALKEKVQTCFSVLNED